MVISFKKNTSTNSCSVEMDIEDFINLTNLINESTRYDSELSNKTLPDTMQASNQSSSSAPNRPSSFPQPHPPQPHPPPTPSSPLHQLQSATSPPAAKTLSTYKFWNSLTTSGETAEEISPVGGQSADNGKELGFAELGISAISAIILPNAAGIIRLVFQSKFYARPVQLLVHNRTGFWLQNAWNPNTFFTEQGEVEEWILQRMFPAICLLSLGSWLVFVSSHSSHSLFPVNFATCAYTSFVLTHWADCSTTDLGLSAVWRGLASLHLFFITFSFKRWSHVAGLSALPSFSLYSYLFFVTYKTRQKWKRHQQAINGYDEEVNNNNNLFNENNSSSREIKNESFRDNQKRRQKQTQRGRERAAAAAAPTAVAAAAVSGNETKDGGSEKDRNTVIGDWWRRKSNSRTGFATFWWNTDRQRAIGPREEEEEEEEEERWRHPSTEDEFD